MMVFVYAFNPILRAIKLKTKQKIIEKLKVFYHKFHWNANVGKSPRTSISIHFGNAMHSFLFNSFFFLKNKPDSVYWFDGVCVASLCFVKCYDLYLENWIELISFCSIEVFSFSTDSNSNFASTLSSFLEN